MSVFGALKSGVSGLFAQSQSMAMISDNIANSNTYGYKKVQATFANMVTAPSSKTSYSSGGVMTQALRSVNDQGLLESSTNSTDMAVMGNGFFAVTDNIVLNPVTEQWEPNGEVFYTRAGQFYPDKDGNLQTPQGYHLLGWKRNDDNTNYETTNVISNFDVVNVETQSISPIATSEIELAANLQATSETGTEFKIASQIVDRLGSVKTLTMTFTKTGETDSDATGMVWDITGTLSDAAYFTQIGEDIDAASSGTLDSIFAKDGSGNPLPDVKLGKISFEANGALKRYIPPVDHNDLVTLIGTAVDTNEDGVTDGIDINTFDGSDIEDTDGNATTANIIAAVDLNADGLADREVDLTIPDPRVPPYSVQDDQITVYYTNQTEQTIDGITYPPRTRYTNAAGVIQQDRVVQFQGRILQSGVDQGGDFHIVVTGANGTSYRLDHLNNVYSNDGNNTLLGTIAPDSTITLNAAGGGGTTIAFGTSTLGAIDVNLGGTLNFYGRAVDNSVSDSPSDNDIDDDDQDDVDGIVDQIDLLQPGEYTVSNTGVVSFATPDVTNALGADGEAGTADDNVPYTQLLADNEEMFDLADVSIVNSGNLYANKYANDTREPKHEVMQLTIDYDGDHVTTEVDGDRVDIKIDFGPVGGITGMTSFDKVSDITQVDQNGQQAGSMTALSVNDDGELSGLFDNGATRRLYQIPVVTFADPLKLDARSNNVFAATDYSGSAVAHAANTGGAGEIAPATLETSSVDIAEEFTKMIVTQRAYSANTKVITTAD
ncbi:MAG: flagellar hook-basal body complex protein, partial [Alphaproteobacteria bacterium]